VSGVDEAAFEEFICDWLVKRGGYGAAKEGENFDAKVGLDTVELFDFIVGTQADRWSELVKRYGPSSAACGGT
jgi:type I restriction enzyme, R subunit